MTKELLQQAVDALESTATIVDSYYIERGKQYTPECDAAITALREALAAPQAEPVAWAMLRADGLVLDVICPDEGDVYQGEYTVPLYAAPPAAPAPVVPSQHIIGYVSPRELEPGPKHGSTVDVYREQMAGWVPVSAAPVVRGPLTDEQIDRIRLETREWHILGYLTAIRFARAIEAHHGIGGGGNG